MPRWGWVVVFIMIFVVYPLCTPPLYWLLNHGYLPFDAYGVLLEMEKPVIYLCKPVPPLWKALVWYDEYWNPRVDTEQDPMESQKPVAD